MLLSYNHSQNNPNKATFSIPVSNNPIENLKELFRQWSGEEGLEVKALPQAGSYRQYFRINGHQRQAIGVYSPDKQENEAFLSFTRHFRAAGLPVSEIYAEEASKNIYLLSDLGPESLFDLLERDPEENRPSESVRNLYRETIAWLPKFQVVAGAGIDYSLCYPVRDFDTRSMHWDLNYFKYFFLRLLRIPFDEYALENDFDELTAYLLQTESRYFMYRDFQARNIMINNGRPYFIDYQGGRRGPLQYDLASLLFQVKANLPYDFRDEMLHWYLENVKRYTIVDEKDFIEKYHAFVLIRLLQVMGAYGFRGYYERRAHFLQSIPYAVNNVRWLLENIRLEPKLPTLTGVLEQIANLNINSPSSTSGQLLTVSINSFSFKNSPPPDYSGNGGGFVFDCRALPNPGRYEHFRQFTGKDAPVIQFLEREPAIGKFLQTVYTLIDQSVKEYMERGFKNLQVNFGCTGGQHRSVYCAEKLARYLEDRYSINVVLNHTQLKPSGEYRSPGSKD